MEKVLIVEDELIVARDLRKTLERNGHEVIDVARTAEKALSLILGQRPTLVLVDIFLKGSLTGIDLAAELNRADIPFIFVSANSNQPVLEAAKTTDPYGFIVKPFREKDLLVSINIARYRYDTRQIRNLPAQTEGSPLPYAPLQAAANHCGIIGKSAPMLHIFDCILQVAPFSTSVLLLGESGTGKEVVANCIVQGSERANKPFIKINCGAIPAALMEAELFGYEKGAFTGALERRPGKFEQATGGTILLDEIGELPLDMQSKLLRVLQDKEIQRLGGSATLQIDVRVIAATSRNLEKEVAEGRFRLDLYYRLYVFPIQIPPLRDRRDDIPMLVNHFIRHYSASIGKKIIAIDDQVLADLQHYHWPGNVRELQFLVERSVVLSAGDTIKEMILPAGITASKRIHIPELSLEEKEKAELLSILRQCNYRIKGADGAAALLNIPPATLFGKMKKLGIKKSWLT